MEIQPNEVESVDVIGRLFNKDVKLIKTMGGFYLAVGKKEINSKKIQALAGGSHQAIVSHELSKQFGSDFHPALSKSEKDKLEKVEEKSQYLPSDSLKNGVELYTLCKNEKLDFVLYRHGITLGKYETEINNKDLIIKRHYFNKEFIKPDRDIANAISRAMKDKVYEYNLTNIVELDTNND